MKLITGVYCYCYLQFRHLLFHFIFIQIFGANLVPQVLIEIWQSALIILDTNLLQVKVKLTLVLMLPSTVAVQAQTWGIKIQRTEVHLI